MVLETENEEENNTDKSIDDKVYYEDWEDRMDDSSYETLPDE